MNENTIQCKSNSIAINPIYQSINLSIYQSIVMPFSSRDAFLNRTKDQTKGNIAKVALFATIAFIASTCLGLSRISIRDFGRVKKRHMFDDGRVLKMDNAFINQVLDILEDERYKDTLTNDLVGDLKDVVLRNEMHFEDFAKARTLRMADKTCRNETSELVGACFAISVADDINKYAPGHGAWAKL